MDFVWSARELAYWFVQRAIERIIITGYKEEVWYETFAQAIE